MFLVYSKVFLRYIVAQEGKLSDLKKIFSIIMSPLKTLKDKQNFNDMAQCYHFFIPNFFWELNIGPKT
jgi:hypothetical protein